VQFAIVRVTPDRRQATALFVSDHIAVPSASQSFEAHAA